MTLIYPFPLYEVTRGNKLTRPQMLADATVISELKHGVSRKHPEMVQILPAICDTKASAARDIVPSEYQSG